jgi:mono/diheme cytochrome c family protein
VQRRMNMPSRLPHVTLLLFLSAIISNSGLGGQDVKTPEAAKLANPVASTPESLVAGKKAYDANCASCHGNMAQGAVKAGVAITIIAEQGGKEAPDLTDDQWDYGSTDGEIYTVVKKGIPPTMMAGWGGRISDTEIWSIVNYIRALAAQPHVTVGPTVVADPTPRPRHALELSAYAQMPITGEPRGENTRGQLARVNFLRDEPGGRRFFVNDLNGPLYILDKQTKQFTTYLDFNGRDGRPGLFPKFTFERNLAIGLTNVIFDPDYARNGVFYTIHTEDPATPAPAAPREGAVRGLDLSGYTTTPAIMTPTVDGRIDREAVLVEWTDTDVTNTTFDGTARELMRLQQPTPIHPMGEMTFNPVAKPGDPEWRVMYIGSGDAGTGEQRDIRRLDPQRLDTLVGKILRIVPDLREHASSSTVSENGRYRIPKDNPFVSIDGARKEIWAVGLRNPHRLVWDADPAQPRAPRLLAFNIGLASWETVVIVKKGANYGYPLREGPQAMTLGGMAPVPADDTIPVQITDTVARGTVKPTYPVIAYPHAANGGDAIAGGVIYRGSIPALKGKLIFGDITTGRVWYAEMSDVLRADDGDPATIATLHAIDAGLRRLTEETFRARGGQGDGLPGGAAISGRGRVDMRFAEDHQGELYILTKSDGMIRRVVGLK